MSSRQDCHRFPCSTAYARGSHALAEDGSVTHYASSGGAESYGWFTGLVAVDDEPWRPWMRLGDEQFTFDTFGGPFTQARDMADGIITAAIWALEANAKDDAADIGSLNALVADYEAKSAVGAET